jgi:hypothetical protein
VKHVAKTKIFARQGENQKQILAYGMDSSIDQELAMILPIPVPRGVADDAVRFIDLSGYARMLVDLDAAFPAMMMRSKSRGIFAAQSRGGPPLQVHDVGDFQASFVPSREDLDRLDPRFTLPKDVWSQLRIYDDWGFVVCKLKPSVSWFKRLFGTSWKTLHPMAFEFPTREPEKLFFPTVHVHDGEVHERAMFDHSLIWQGRDTSVVSAEYDAAIDASTLAAGVFLSKTMGVIDPTLGARKITLMGELENQDTWV